MSKSVDQKNLQVTVIVTVLNEAATIAYLLNALVRQTFLPKAVIIIDGGSSDQTIDLLREAQAKISQFQLLFQQVPGNRSIGRNAAIELARTELIAITDAGCQPDPTWLAELVKAEQEGEAQFNREVVVAGYYRAEPATPLQEAIVPYALVMPDKINPDDFLPATRSMLLSKSIWKQTGEFDPCLSDNEDYAFAHRLRHSQIPIVFAEKAKVVWQPPSTLAHFQNMIFRFARGDMYAGIVRPKVLILFIRYIGGTLGLLFLIWLFNDWTISALLAIGSTLVYAGWAGKKNQRYAPNGFHWLPVLQFIADYAVMLGSIVGIVMRLIHAPDQHTLEPDQKKS